MAAELAAAIVASASVLHEQHTERKVVELKVKRSRKELCTVVNNTPCYSTEYGKKKLYCEDKPLQWWLANGWTIEIELHPDPDTSFLVLARKRKTPRPRPTGEV